MKKIGSLSSFVIYSKAYRDARGHIKQTRPANTWDIPSILKERVRDFVNPAKTKLPAGGLVSSSITITDVIITAVSMKIFLLRLSLNFITGTRTPLSNGTSIAISIKILLTGSSLQYFRILH